MALLLFAALGLPARAGAAVTIGQLPGEAPVASCTGGSGGFDYLQTSVTGGTLYVAREAGTITSWSTDSAGAGATYTLKIFRRTSDPDVFQVIAHTSPHTLTAGLNTVSSSVAVESGDLIGLHESGPLNSCTFFLAGDSVLRASSDLADGGSAVFGGVTDVRLNLQAVLAPTNTFTFAGLSRDRSSGTARLTLDLSNPGTVAVGGRGLKKAQSKNLFVPGAVVFPIAAVGKLRHRLGRTGQTTLRVNATFTPIGGDPSTQTFALKLKRRRHAPSV
jgi:hypothetical protein